MTNYEPIIDPKPLWKPEHVAQKLGISVKAVHKFVREGKLTCVQVTARERRFTEEQVQQYIESRSTGTTIDKRVTAPVSSRPKKGGENSKFVGVGGKDLRKEMKKWR